MIVRGTTPTIRFTFDMGATQMLDGEMGIFEIVRC